MAFRFRDCQNCFCLLLTSSTLTFPISLIPGTFHPRQWPLSSPHCPTSIGFTFGFNPLDPALTGKAVVHLHLHQNVLPLPSDVFCFQRGYRVFRGPCDPHRRPPSQSLENNLLQSNRF